MPVGDLFITPSISFFLVSLHSMTSFCIDVISHCISNSMHKAQRHQRFSQNATMTTAAESGPEDESVGKVVFRCVLASLYVDLSVRPSVHPSVQLSVGLSVTRFFGMRENACFRL